MYKIFNYKLLAIGSFILFIILNVFFLIPSLFNYALIALGLGLRHGLDADHIIAIDNITRKLVAEKKPAASTGLFFALGHSTIVFCLTLMVVIGITHSQVLYFHLKEMGDKIGSVVSILFLVFTLSLNVTMIKSLHCRAATKVKCPGLIYKIVNKYVFKLVDRPEKMFIVGFFFGLGFDTATEIGLLSLAATSLLHGFSRALILLLPLLFAAGMMITDTVNSSFMAGLYVRVNQDFRQLKRYNYLILGFASLATILVISIEGFHYLSQPTAVRYFAIKTIERLGENSDIVGAFIAGVFVILGLLICYKSVNSFASLGKSKA